MCSTWVQGASIVMMTGITSALLLAYLQGYFTETVSEKNLKKLYIVALVIVSIGWVYSST